MHRLLLVTLLAFVLVDTSAACKSAKSRIIVKDGKAYLKWECPSEQVLYEHGKLYQCVEKCAKCPNGFCHRNECHCFPGTSRDSEGVCGKICKDCENGWCSSKSTCECSEGLTLSQGQCLPSCDSPGHTPDPRLELPLQFLPGLVEATAADRPDPSEVEMSVSSPEVQSCQTDYVWDPEAMACIPYESANAPDMDIRMDD